MILVFTSDRQVYISDSNCLDFIDDSCYLDRQVYVTNSCYLDRQVYVTNRCYLDRQVYVTNRCYLDRQIYVGNSVWLNFISNNYLDLVDNDD